MKKMTKFFALALLAGAMVSCSTEDIAPSTFNLRPLASVALDSVS